MVETLKLVMGGFVADTGPCPFKTVILEGSYVKVDSVA